MYKFRTLDGREFTTEFSPKETFRTNWIIFDAFDSIGDRQVILTNEIDLKTFEFIKP